MNKTLKTNQHSNIRPFIEKLYNPKPHSHKGQNGKLLIVGGSHLFHSASIWAAEIASHFVDMVHYCSTDENNEIMKSLKLLFRNGIVVSRRDMDTYIHEDDVILIGPGLERNNETKALTEKMLKEHSDKRFVLDACSLQMMEASWLRLLQRPSIITPHQKEFEQLFQVSVSNTDLDHTVEIVQNKAKEYKCVILLKVIVDIISNGIETVIVEGGNQGLTKGGTGDILAGLVASLFTKNDSYVSSVVASYLLKISADELYHTKGTWYNNTNLINIIPDQFHNLTK